MYFISGNHIQLLRSGVEYFPALEHAIDNAQHSIYLQTYIYEADEVGTRIANAMINAVNRRVSVHLLIDGFGSKMLPKPYIESLRTAGINVMVYRQKVSPWTFKKNRLRRLHQKVAVIDDIVAFVGGINIIDDHNVPHQTAPRIDYAVCVQGALLPIISNNVKKLWQRLAWLHFHSKPILTPNPRTPTHYTKVSIKAAFVTRDNILHRSDIETAYLRAIESAKHEIIIANAYFIPGRRFRKALISAAKRGVKVKLLLQGRKEYFLMFATHAFYHVFLKNGIEIYEYRKSFMHSKVAVIDQEWSTVGSSNIDPFSLFLAREANVFVKDKHFSTALHEDIHTAIHDGAYQIKVNEWAKGNSAKRFLSWIAYGLVRLFLGIIGYTDQH
ncbi:MAG: cardiolipin synthase ClsB [Methylotenera sp.]|jgi:cardiolipin synthase|uniref:cardiolipin synthase ClsB n=1 Tax=Methylotenera sp. TaxID=2051956 RepID=UPI002719829E|nr:cardiolipin synthase ClsB [Methylotenera sp.]MDO9151167.1 cardiolipin synthase ClsB [Methylotenera sp.]